MHHFVELLRKKAQDADNWADSYEGQRQERWLREHARLHREAADSIERLVAENYKLSGSTWAEQ